MFGWTYLDDNGEETGFSGRFKDQKAAEDWMGQSWQQLVEFGVAEVVLYDHGRGAPIYRMGLTTG